MLLIHFDLKSNPQEKPSNSQADCDIFLLIQSEISQFFYLSTMLRQPVNVNQMAIKAELDGLRLLKSDVNRYAALQWNEREKKWPISAL